MHVILVPQSASNNQLIALNNNNNKKRATELAEKTSSFSIWEPLLNIQLFSESSLRDTEKQQTLNSRLECSQREQM